MASSPGSFSGILLAWQSFKWRSIKRSVTTCINAQRIPVDGSVWFVIWREGHGSKLCWTLMGSLNAYQKMLYNHTLHLLCHLLNTASQITVLTPNSCHPIQRGAAGVPLHQLLALPGSPEATTRYGGWCTFPPIKCKLRVPWSTLMSRSVLCATLPASTHPCLSSFTVKGEICTFCGREWTKRRAITKSAILCCSGSSADLFPPCHLQVAFLPSLCQL